jgi:hypothetical protein
MDPDNAIPAITPYLRMKVGSIALIPYAKPGSELLFHLVREQSECGRWFSVCETMVRSSAASTSWPHFMVSRNWKQAPGLPGA